ncbi:MAG: glucosidase [Kineosporiaceae bacterium]
MAAQTPEHERLAGDHAAWMRWGPYLAERAWATVREDYSADGDAWGSFPYEQARSRAYRWNEDGIAGVCDDQQHLCLALALWNGEDATLKERMFGLTGPQGNHGEDVKEYWWYTDAVPSHAWLEYRYAYPLTAFPYDDLVAENARRRDRGPDEGEYELLDTGAFDPEPGGVDGSGRWAEVTVQYAKADPDDLVMRIGVENASVHPATVHVLPTLWFRNTWSWRAGAPRPTIGIEDDVVVARHPRLGAVVLAAAPGPDGAAPTPLLCDNDTNTALLYGAEPLTAFPKDGIGDHVTRGTDSVNPGRTGTKLALHYVLHLAGRESAEIVVRLTSGPDGVPRPGADVADGARSVLAQRKAEADEFHAAMLPDTATDDERVVARQAVAGLIWTKQFYFYDVDLWLDGDPAQPEPPHARRRGRNAGWRHLNNRDVLSMPDSWEYPWYAAWDLAFHAVALAHVDPQFAKEQLLLLLREWYMHPNGQLPAYEWALGDVNPPVHAWAAMRVFEIDGSRDFDFLEKVLHKLLLNFTWWVNRKDVEGNNIFEGGFLGMDNIGPIDRSNQVPVGAVLEQSDATSWMAMFCLDLLEMCLRLAAYHDHVYEDLATKFLEHFAYVATAMRDGDLWDGEDGFYYDVLTTTDVITGQRMVERLRAQSMVGLLPLFAVRLLPQAELTRVPEFDGHLRWFMDNKPRYAAVISGDQDSREPGGREGAHLLAVVRLERLQQILQRVLDEAQFLAPTGIRSLSKAHAGHPFSLELGPGWSAAVDYEPAESRSGLFGGNSNWRGPIWFPVNHLLVESLRRYGSWTDALPDGPLTVELPTGSGRRLTLTQAADELATRLVSTFLPGPDGVRPALRPAWDRMPASWRDRILFHEYFHGDHGAGLGAGHQTGWTALVIDLIHDLCQGRAG